jgi:tRNA splicing ligase
MLNVQEFLLENQNGLELLKVEPYNLDIKEYESGLVVLNYNQINSPKYDPIVMECRGLILDSKDSWKIVAKSFRRFFNYGEGDIKYPDVSKGIVFDSLPNY